MSESTYDTFAREFIATIQRKPAYEPISYGYRLTLIDHYGTRAGSLTIEGEQELIEQRAALQSWPNRHQYHHISVQPLTLSGREQAEIECIIWS